jgi:hypothetical protein
VLNFSRDFSLVPQLLSKAQLLDVYHAATLTPTATPTATPTVTPTATASGVVTATATGAQGIGQGMGMGQVLDSQIPESQVSHSQVPYSVPAPAPAAHTPSLSFAQFLDFIALLALRCPLFSGDDANIVKLGNLLLLLGQSQGLKKLGKRFPGREVVVFRVNPVTAAVAAAAGGSRGMR